jgi:hypothetical protein
VRAISVGNQQLIALLLLAGLAFGGSYVLSHVTIGMGFLVAVGLLIGVVAFLRTELAIYLLIIAMLLSPQFGAGGASAARGKGVTLRFDDFLILVVGVAWFFKSALYKELNLLAHTPVNHAAFFYATSCIVSTLVGIQAGNVTVLTGSLFVLKYLEYFLVFWMVINNTHSEPQIRRYLIVLFAVALIVSIVAISQIPSGVRVSAPFEGEKGEPNTLGGYLLFVISLLMGIGLGFGKYWKTSLALICVMIIPFIYTLSRASYFAFPVAVLTVLFLRRQFMIVVALAFVSLVFLAAPDLAPKAVKHRIEYTFHQAPQPGQATVLGRRLDTSTSARIESFSAAISAFQERPILGWGITGWGFIDSQYFRTLVETGIVGIATFLYLLYRVLAMSRQTLKFLKETDPFYYGLTCGFIGGMVGLLVHAIGSNTFIIVRVMEPFWLLCAVIFLLPRLLNQGSETVAPVLSRFETTAPLSA